MSELIISHFLSKVVPNDASKLTDFQKVVKLSCDFEAALEELMFISPSDGKDKRLSEFANNVEVHFASRKKVEILAETRHMLLRAGYSIPPVEDFIRAIFTDSTLRRECLLRIQSTM